MAMRIDSDEKNVLDLVSEILGVPYHWQYCFPTLLGDSGKSGRRRKLPVDAYFTSHNLIVEYREKQHFEPVPIMDRRMTISGVSRGEQRRRYDSIREQWAKEYGYKLLVICYNELSHKKNGRLIRNKSKDLKVIQRKLDSFLSR